MARSDTDEYCQSSGTMDSPDMVQDFDVTFDSKGNDTTIHSGHFMVSCVHDRELEDDDGTSESGNPVGGAAEVAPKGFNFNDAPKKPVACYQFGNSSTHIIGIDSSLTKLFECMTLAYSGKLTSPKWKNFKGIKLRLKEKIRLNNIIWREWHMQFIQGQRPVVCQFEPPISDKVHSKPEAVVLEGKYWKRRLESVTAEYKKWRLFFKQRAVAHMSESEFVEEFMSHTRLLQRLAQQDALRPPWQLASTQLPSSLTDKLPYEDDDLMDFSDTLFTTFQDKNFVFPHPREMSGLGNADIIQPGLIQLQPNFEDFVMDTTLEPLPSLTEMFGVQTSRAFTNNNEGSIMYQSRIPASSSTAASSNSMWNSAPAATGAPPPENNFADLNSTRFQSDVALGDNLELDMFNSSQMMDVNQGTATACVVRPVPPQPTLSQPAPPQQVAPLPPATTAPSPITITATQLDTTAPRIQDASQIISLILQQQAAPLQVQLQQQQLQQQQLLRQQQQQQQQQHQRTQPQTVRIETAIAPAPVMNPTTQTSAISTPQTMTIIQNRSQLETLLQSINPTQTHTVLDASSIVQALNPTASVASRQVIALSVDKNNDPRRASTGSLNNHGKVTQKKDGDFLVPQPFAVRTKPRSLAPAPPSGTVPANKSSIAQQNSFLAQLLRPQGTSTFLEGGIRVKQEEVVLPTTIIKQTYIPVATGQPIVTTTPQYTITTNSVTEYQKSLIMAATCKALNTSPAKITEAMASVPMASPAPTSTISAPDSPGSPNFSVPSPVFSVPSPSSDCSSPGKPYHGKSDSDRQQYKETRRTSHITAEKKRRGNIKVRSDGFDTLHHLVPSLNQNPNAKVSKAATLNKTAEFCRKLKSERATMQKEAEILKQEIEALNSSISICQQQLPATGVPVTRQRVDQMREMFDDYVRNRTRQNWKFWIFSIIIRPLFDSYNNMVSTTSIEDLCRTVLAWLEQHCSLVALRPGVLNSLRHLSTTTTILSDPSRVPEQAAQAVARKPVNNNPS